MDKWHSVIIPCETRTETSTGCLTQVPENELSLAHRTMLHVYRNDGIVAGRHLKFWDSFREKNPDIELSSRELRELFYGDFLAEPDNFRDMDVSVEQYLNPRFNQLQLDALAFGDLTSDKDFTMNKLARGDSQMSFEELMNYIVTPLQKIPDAELTPIIIDPKKVELKTRDDELCERFHNALSKVLYLGAEIIEKPVLDKREILERVLALTAGGICLEDLLKPNMDYSNLLSSSENWSVPKQTMPMPLTLNKLSSCKRFKSSGDSVLQITPRLVIPSSIKFQYRKRMKRLLSASHKT